MASNAKIAAKSSKWPPDRRKLFPRVLLYTNIRLFREEFNRTTAMGLMFAAHCVQWLSIVKSIGIGVAASNANEAAQIGCRN